MSDTEPNCFDALPAWKTAEVFDHVTIRVADREASRRFYGTVLGALGRSITHSTDEFDESDDRGIAPESRDRPKTRRPHVGFTAASRADVDAFWRSGVDGEPGLRPEYTPDYYGAFVLDLYGNNIEAVHDRGR